MPGRLRARSRPPSDGSSPLGGLCGFAAGRKSACRTRGVLAALSLLTPGPQPFPLLSYFRSFASPSSVSRYRRRLLPPPSPFANFTRRTGPSQSDAAPDPSPSPPCSQDIRFGGSSRGNKCDNPRRRPRCLLLLAAEDTPDSPISNPAPLAQRLSLSSSRQPDWSAHYQSLLRRDASASAQARRIPALGKAQTTFFCAPRRNWTGPSSEAPQSTTEHQQQHGA